MSAHETPDELALARTWVVHQDAHLLVLAKPSGLPTTSPEGERGRSLTSLARRVDPRAPKMHPSSRLDRDVTGLVTYARTDRGIQALLAARRKGLYRRLYVAITTGVLPDHGSWSWSIAIDPKDRTLRVALDPGQRGDRLQDARTTFTRAAVTPTSFSLAHLFPRTGRTHQLRVHAARAGHPLAGDVSYGGGARLVLPDGRVVTPRRPMLHCAMLALPDVERGGTLELRAEIPEDMARTWTTLGGDPAAVALPDRPWDDAVSGPR